MKILMVTPYLPYPPASGGQIRTLNLLKYLSKKNEIVLVCLYKKDSDKRFVSYLKPFCREIYLCKRSEKPWALSNILKSIFSFYPFLVVRNYSSEASNTLKRLLKENTFDVIHTETFYVMPHVPKTKTPIFLVEQTIEFKVYQHFVNSLPFIFRIFLYPDIMKLKYWERFFWKKATMVATVSDQDKKIVNSMDHSMMPVVIPNGAGEEMILETLEKKDLRHVNLLFQGNFFWLQNVEAANYLIKNIYPKIKAKFPRITLTIAGQNAKKIQNGNDIIIKDIAHDDTESVKKAYREATLFIAPIFGPGGTRLKILAAMACGLPVVSTKIGVEGLDLKDKENVLIADAPDEFVSKIETILSDPARYNELRKSAYQLIQKKYNWKQIAQSLETAYSKITS
ncbi:MAG: glycosyltransferase family 4 protein [Patescibacteria group bacterium]